MLSEAPFRGAPQSSSRILCDALLVCFIMVYLGSSFELHFRVFHEVPHGASQNLILGVLHEDPIGCFPEKVLRVLIEFSFRVFS